MGLFSSRAAEQLFIQSSQPTGQQAGALWVDNGQTPNPEFKIFDGTDWNQQEPTGSIQPWGGPVASIPSGFLLCNDQAVSRITFANLFDVIGTFYGIGDGSSTFNVPDLRAKFPRGAANAADPGSEGGEDTHALTEGELATHSHGVTDAGHVHTIPASGSAGSVDIALNSAASGTVNTSSVTTGVTIDNTGSGTAHENRPVFQEVLYIIKT